MRARDRQGDEGRRSFRRDPRLSDALAGRAPRGRSAAQGGVDAIVARVDEARLRAARQLRDRRATAAAFHR